MAVAFPEDFSYEENDIVQIWPYPPIYNLFIDYLYLVNSNNSKEVNHEQKISMHETAVGQTVRVYVIRDNMEEVEIPITLAARPIDY